MSEQALKLTIYFSERDRSGQRLLADALFDLYERHRLRTSVLLRGVAGFGRRHRLQSDRLLTLSESLPAVSVAVDTRASIERALPEVLEVTGHGLITLERATLFADSELEDGLALHRQEGRALKLTFYGGRSVRSDGEAGYVAAVAALREAGLAGASALLAVDGTLHGERRRASFFARNAHVPLMLLTIGGDVGHGATLRTVLSLLDEPVLTAERVQVCRARGGSAERPRLSAEHEDSGLPIWQKVMVHVEEQAKIGGRPLYVELARRLGEAGAHGVTVLRGVRGFYAGGAVLTDRITSMRRNVPMHVIALDTPAAVQRWWPVIEELTIDSGLVTSELVPACHAVSR